MTKFHILVSIVGIIKPEQDQTNPLLCVSFRNNEIHARGNMCMFL